MAPLLFTTPVPDSRKATEWSSIEPHWLGLIDYEPALQFQYQIAKSLRPHKRAVILGLEHNPVVTLGVRGLPEADLLCAPEHLSQSGFELRRIDRGGQATLHNPGQLVIYPICDLRALGLGVRDFLCCLQKITRTTLSEFGIESELGLREPGLFTSRGKIAAFGLRIQNGISLHGLSINVCNELKAFGLIRNCGARVSQVTRMVDFVPQLSLTSVWNSWLRHAESELPLEIR